MKILVTGVGGMLGQTLVPCLNAREHEVVGMDRDQLDVTDFAAVLKSFSHTQPELIIHAAAYTKVDQAESEAELAYLINGYGTENIAVAAACLNVPVLYVSTDYVFDGTSTRPYTTWDTCNPLSIYGKSKLAGELAIQRHLSRFYIVRTSWLYGPTGQNFVYTIRKLAAERDVLRVVSDQLGTPTCTLSLSECIADLIETDRWGVYHATDGGVTSWYEFARAVLNGQPVKIEPIETEAMPRPATRPKYSVLDKTTLTQTIGRQVIPWRESLEAFLELESQGQPI